MILSAAETQKITQLNQLVWRPYIPAMIPAAFRAEISTRYYVTSPTGANATVFYVLENNTAPQYLPIGREAFKRNLAAGQYADVPPVYYQPPPPVITQTPAIDPGPGAGNNSGPADLASWFNDNQLYIYGAAAILAAAFLFKRKK